MIKNYLKIAARLLMKYKGYAFINIAGLTIGMTCALLILFYIRYELSFDRYHENANEIYRIVMYQKGNRYQGTEWFNATPGALKPTVTQEIPEVLMSTRARNRSGIIRHQNSIGRETDIRFADPEFLQMFTFPLISGDPATALIEPFSLLLTEEMVEKYFGLEDPIGEILNIDDRDYTITGVLKSIPENSHFTFDFIASFNTLYSIRSSGREGIEIWGSNNIWNTYILTEKNTNKDVLEAKLRNISKKYKDEDSEHQFRLQPLTSIHLHSNLNFDAPNVSDVRTVYLFSAIGFLVMLIACLNYVNLSTSRSLKRAKEIGIRKVVGAYKINLIKQFFSESLVFVVIAMMLSVFLLTILLPPFGVFINRNLTFNMLFEPSMLLGLVALTFLVGLVSGGYPAFCLSAIKPSVIFRGMKKTTSHQHFDLRNILVVLQFIISIALTICALVVYSQLNFIMKKNIGFQKDHIIYGSAGESLRQNFEPFKEELKKQVAFTDVYTTGEIPISIGSNSTPDWEGKEEGDGFHCYYGVVDYNFIDFFKIEIVAGRDFSKDHGTDQEKAWILNEAAVRAIGWDNPVGKKFGYSWQNPDGRVIGVVKDFHNTSLKLHVEPMSILLVKPDRIRSNYAVKIGSENIPETIKLLEEIHNQFSPDYPFRYQFLDERIDRMYQSEQKLGQIFNIFTGIALFISCLGLYGLVSFSVEQKTKEIGIRKVLGASVGNVVRLVSKEFLFLVTVANIIAWPVAWYAMHRWLQQFAFRVDLDIFVFIGAWVAAIIIALISIGYQSIRAAQLNPVDSLRYE